MIQNMKIRLTFFALLAVLTAVSCGPKDGKYVLHLYTTNDVHGRYFDSLYVGNATNNSLLAVSRIVDSLRNVHGEENVVLVDAGDCVQGDNASYYFNYVDTVSVHLYARMADYMKYDAVVVGNHDIEAGHPVYDRLDRQMKAPLLAANAIRTDNGNAYFDEYTIIRRHGLKIAIVGLTNPNIKNWLSPELWSGMEFESLIPKTQEVVDKVIAKEKPQVVIVAVHAGTGAGDGSSYESQGLDLMKSLKGVDFLICSHDHRPAVFESDSICLINSGSHCRNVGEGTLEIEIKDGKVVSKALSAGLIPVDKSKVDTAMRAHFRADYEAVKDFTLRPVGELAMPLVTRDSYRGMCDYINFLHTVSLSCAPAQISFAAPLNFDGMVEPGTLIYNDLFKIYPFENQLFVVQMTGKEIKDYLEYSYGTWINTVSGKAGEHLLKMENKPDPRTGLKNWSFINRAYNFDSAGGLLYEVDIRKPEGERVNISALASGEAFSEDSTYNVAMTSYRASGGGGLMRAGAGIDTDRIDERVVARYPEIREIIYDYIGKVGTLTPEVVGNQSVIGHWEFVPEDLSGKLLNSDMSLLFPGA